MVYHLPLILFYFISHISNFYSHFSHLVSLYYHIAIHCRISSYHHTYYHIISHHVADFHAFIALSHTYLRYRLAAHPVICHDGAHDASHDSSHDFSSLQQPMRSTRGAVLRADMAGYLSSRSLFLQKRHQEQ